MNLDVNGPDFLDVGGSANNIPNPDLEWGQSHETSASLERELVPNVSVRGLWVFKRVINELRSRGLVNSLRPRSVWNQAFTRRDPGPDGVLNTGDDGGTVTLYDYDPAYRGARFVANIIPNIPSDREDRFQNFEVSLSKRTGAGKWFANTAMLATRNHRWIEAFPETPNSDRFPLDETWDWMYRFGGGYTLPYQITASSVYQIFSGVSGQRTAIFRAADPDGGPRFPSSSTITLRMEPFGATRLLNRHLMDVRLSKAIGLGGRRLKLDLDIFNVLNTNAAFNASFLSGAAYGYVTTIAPPRVLRLGTSLEF